MEIISRFFELPFGYAHKLVVMLVITVTFMIMALLGRIMKQKGVYTVSCLAVIIIDSFALIPLYMISASQFAFVYKAISLIILVFLAYIIKEKYSLKYPQGKGMIFFSKFTDILFPVIHMIITLIITYAIIKNGVHIVEKLA